MTNAKTVQRPEFRCGECDAWARTKELADQCGKCATCNMPVKHNGAGWEDCTKCSRQKRNASAALRLGKAKDVSTETPNGMLYIDHELYPNFAPYDGRWCTDGGEALDYFDPGHHVDECDKVEEGEECPHQPPEEIWAYDSTPITTFTLDAEDIINNALESDYPEEARDMVIDLEEFETFLKGWLAKQNINCFEPDYTRKIRLK